MEPISQIPQKTPRKDSKDYAGWKFATPAKEPEDKWLEYICNQFRATNVGE